MNCPNCNTLFKEVALESTNRGISIKLDQCPNCGGIWFDQYELYQVPKSKAGEIDKVDESLLGKLTPIKIDLLCPKDRVKLSRFYDANIPKEIHINRCEKCGGIWLNRGELSRYKEELEKKTKKPNQELEKVIGESIGHSSYLSALANIGEFLMTPLARTGSSPMEFIPLDTRLKSPYEISSNQSDLIKSLPLDKKLKFYNLIIEENKRQRKEEEAVGRGVMGVISIIRLILTLLIK